LSYLVTSYIKGKFLLKFHRNPTNIFIKHTALQVTHTNVDVQNIRQCKKLQVIQHRKLPSSNEFVTRCYVYSLQSLSFKNNLWLFETISCHLVLMERTVPLKTILEVPAISGHLPDRCSSQPPFSPPSVSL